MANSRICSIPDCGKPDKTKGFCAKHYTRLLRHGDPLTTKTTPIGDPHKFYAEVVLVYKGDECLIWPYGRSGNGYGQATFNGKKGDVHRFLCEDVNGPPPTPEHHAAHSCGKGKSGCVTKGHLSWKTPKENNADKLYHGTHQHGAKNHRATLTESQVREILSLKGKETQESIAARFGVVQQTISSIHSGCRWPSIINNTA